MGHSDILVMHKRLGKKRKKNLTDRLDLLAPDDRLQVTAVPRYTFQHHVLTSLMALLLPNTKYWF